MLISNKREANLKKLSNKEDDILKTLQVALEMLQRGYKFTNIDYVDKLVKKHKSKKEDKEGDGDNEVSSL